MISWTGLQGSVSGEGGTARSDATPTYDEGMHRLSDLGVLIEDEQRVWGGVET